VNRIQLAALTFNIISSKTTFHSATWEISEVLHIALGGRHGAHDTGHTKQKRNKTKEQMQKIIILT